MKTSITSVIIFLLCAAGAFVMFTANTIAQQLTPANGMRVAEPKTIAIVGATVRVSPTESIEHGTVIFKDGLITAVGDVDQITIPDSAIIINADGFTLAPAFIETRLDVPVVRADGGDGRHALSRVHPEVDIATMPLPEDRIAILRKAGFAAAFTIPATGALAGTAALVPLNNSAVHRGSYLEQNPMVLRFEYGGNWQTAEYPGSLTGAVALVRQTLYDARWYAQNTDVAHAGNAIPPQPSDSFAALRNVVEGNQFVLFDLKHELDALLAQNVAEEFDLDYAMFGTGTEYRRLDEIASLQRPMIIPIDFPKRPDISTPDLMDSVSLRTLMSWEQAPTNPRRLLQEGIPITITMTGCSNGDTFLKNIQKAIKQGLSEEDAFAALTTIPASFGDLDSRLGTIRLGAYANLQLVKGDVLDPERTLRDVWINGRRYRMERDRVPSGATSYELTIGEVMFTAEIDSENRRFTMSGPDGKRVSLRKTKVTLDGITAVIDTQVVGGSGWGSLILIAVGDELTGTITMSDGTRLSVLGKPSDQAKNVVEGELYTGWMKYGSRNMEATLELQSNTSGNAIFRIGDREFSLKDLVHDQETGQIEAWFESFDGGHRDINATLDGEEIRGSISGGRREASLHLILGNEPPPESGAAELAPELLPTPFGAYGRFEPPTLQDVRFHHVTIWTSADDGIIEDGCLIIRDGRIAHVGPMSGAPRAKSDEEIVDAPSMHITPGLIDAHSHTGLRGGVNEWTQTNTAEVRMVDSINPDDINFYRQLAGGLTTANQLHGSANPIGGQNSVVQLRWGNTTDEMLFREAKPGIKFALGENVKRSSDRYPNTRMGVETFDRDAFLAAVDYRKAWNDWDSLPTLKQNKSPRPRKDLELDILVEILESDRLIHCHSYRQDEILMLMRLAEDLGFTIGTLQHVLEGYKVAEVIVAHGADASCFSDWWAYKEEVMDAIPYNGAIMHDVGAVVSFNSDSSNLARRMNTEATKAIRWGDLTPEEALKFVTINPAHQLRIDDRVGSLELGKQADIAVWNGNPLATDTSCVQTWIAGAPYFDIDEDAQLQSWASSERMRLIDAVLAAEYGELEPPSQESEPTEEEYSCQDH